MTKPQGRVIRGVLKYLLQSKNKFIFFVPSLILLTGLVGTVYASNQPDTTQADQVNLVDESVHLATNREVPVVGFSEPVITIKIEESQAEKADREAKERVQNQKKQVAKRDVIARSIPQRSEPYQGDIRSLGRDRVVARWDESQWAAFDSIVQRESGWVVGNRNGSSGACGLGQAYPCSKLGDGYGNAEAELNWTINYIASRYSTPEKALSFKNARGWY